VRIASDVSRDAPESFLNSSLALSLRARCWAMADLSVAVFPAF
jgi:hypothetical protein